MQLYQRFDVVVRPACNFTKYEIPTHNLVRKVGDKFIKLSKISFSMECFTADFLRLFLPENVKI